MTELEKLKAGLEYNFYDKEVAGIKGNALKKCQILNSIDPMDNEKQLAAIKDLFGTVKNNASVQPFFNCDNGKNIHVGEDFLANYNVTILDIAEVRIGDYCMIGPNTLITTVGHPISPKGRWERKAQGMPVNIGNDVWIGARCIIRDHVTIGGNCTILPGVTIGNNVVIAAGVPAKVIKQIENDL